MDGFYLQDIGKSPVCCHVGFCRKRWYPIL